MESVPTFQLHFSNHFSNLDAHSMIVINQQFPKLTALLCSPLSRKIHSNFSSQTVLKSLAASFVYSREDMEFNEVFPSCYPGPHGK